MSHMLFGNDKRSSASGFIIFLVILFALAVTGLSLSLHAHEPLPTKKNPLIIDRTNKQVMIYAEFNAKHLHKPTTHFGVISKDGKFADKAILITYANHLVFHNALIEIGANPGDNLSKESNGERVEGDELIVTATWPGLNKELPLSDLISDAAGKGFRIKFGGNKAAAAKENTGCVTCLESCWVGITSNANYPSIGTMKRFVSPNSHFQGRADVLPDQERYPVILIYRLKK
ncbi:MAG: YdjY domain-containing protein [Nitrospirota bacterium]